jgi:hypothetical protein
MLLDKLLMTKLYNYEYYCCHKQQIYVKILIIIMISLKQIIQVVTSLIFVIN